MTNAGELPRFSYRPYLDGLRAIAVLLVLAVHASYGRFQGGFLGVDVFFVLSGFLITCLLMDEAVATGRIDLTAFYARRVFRILPPLVLCLALAGLFWDMGFAQFMYVAAAVLTFVANFFTAEFLGSMAHAWSLSIEEQFYLLWPFIVLLMFLRNARLLLAFALAIALISLLFRFHLIGIGQSKLAYSVTPARMDALMWGCILALCRASWITVMKSIRNDISSGLAMAALAGILLCGVFASKAVMEGWAPAFTLFAVLVTLLLGLLEVIDDNAPARWVLSRPVLVYVGRRSYGLYLYHYPIFQYLENWRIAGSAENFLLVTIAKIVLAFAVTEVSFRLVETPILQWKRRWNDDRRRRSAEFDARIIAK